MIAIIGAMNEEINELCNVMSIEKVDQWQGFKFYIGSFENKKVVVTKTGVGKVLSAMLTQKLISVYGPSHILFTGIAGSLNINYKIGDMVIVNDCIQHDMDATAMGFKLGEIPYTKIHIVKCDNNLIKLANKYKNSEFSIHNGRVLTGDQFFTHSGKDSHKYLINELKGDAIEMEGASVGTVSSINETPFLIIRIISDKADGKAPKNFSDFLKIASNQLLGITKFITSNL